MGELRIFLPDELHAELYELKERTGQRQNELVVDLLTEALDKRRKACRAPIVIVDMADKKASGHAEP
jgi:hypothetical protein